jgi:MGT family glycosyltransferase
MRRFLFVVPPLTGHVNPAAAVGAELATRGHDVAWAGHRGMLEALLPAGARVFPAISDTLMDWMEDGRDRWQELRGVAGLKFFWEDFALPLARAMLPGTTAAIASFAPDVVVADQQALAGAVAARRAGIIWATSATSPGPLVRPTPPMPKVEEWIIGQMAALQRDSGLSDPVDLRFSEHLVLAYTTPALLGDISHLGGQFVYTGPALARRPERGSFPWDWLDPGRARLLVSLGTLNGPAGERFFRVVLDALADLGEELQAVIAAPAAGQSPPHVLFAGHVPQLALLRRMSAVVSHGGHNTVCESLAHGLPLVVTPIRDDQSIVAHQVAGAGAGIRLRFARLRAGEFRDAVRAVLTVPAYRAAAERVRESFAIAGGAVAAADHLEKLL